MKAPVLGPSVPRDEILPDEQVVHSVCFPHRGDDPIKYLLFKNYNHYAIVNDEADFIVGRVQPVNGVHGPFRVEADLSSLDEVAIVNTLEEAIPKLAAYYEKNPPKWERHNPMLYEKWTLFALLRIEQDQRRNWLAYRDDYPMLRDGNIGKFCTFEEAQRAADAHHLDYYPNSKVIDDRLTWLRDPEIGDPRRVEDRARWQRNAGATLPDVPSCHQWQGDPKST